MIIESWSRFESDHWYTLQVELIGNSIFDYVHQSDHAELADQLGVSLAHQQRISSNSSHHSSPLHNENTSPAAAGAPLPGSLGPGGGGVLLPPPGAGSGGQSPAIPDGKPCK